MLHEIQKALLTTLTILSHEQRHIQDVDVDAFGFQKSFSATKNPTYIEPFSESDEDKDYDGF